jgi:redox-sensing transcriptional repressor
MSRRTRSDKSVQGIPEATIARLPLYLRALYALADRDTASVSSEELAAAAGVNSAKLRKDLSHLGSYGTRGVGYDVDYLIYQVSRELGLTQDWPVIIVGAGNLGRALANYGGFATRGFRVAAMIDSDQQVVGTSIAGHRVYAADEIERVVARFGVMIGAITVPAVAAQGICDRLVAAGVSSILNFAPVVLNVPEGVDVRKVDLSIELQILAFHAQRRSAGGSGGLSPAHENGSLEALSAINGTPLGLGPLATHGSAGDDGAGDDGADDGGVDERNGTVRP